MLERKISVKQLSVGGFDDNFSYVIHDSKSKDTAVVDPCGDVGLIERTLREIRDFVPKYILLTHGHHDHTSGVSAIKNSFNAPVVAHPSSSFPHNISPGDSQKLPFGNIEIECVYSPGHTSDSIIYHLSDDSAIFTGDTLFIDWCGYCNAETMFKTMREIIWPLADSNIVYPGHNYGRVPFAPLGEEKKKNPYLNTTDFAKFKEILKEL